MGSPSRPLRVAVIGAGPAAFYAAEALFKTPDLVVKIDMFNRLPTPFGLVREGVAPDHESIKAVTRVYEKTASNPNFNYFGNVTFGVDLSHEEIISLYDQVIYAVGAQTDRKMGIPGEDLAGSYPATIFVGWYNGHPDYRDLKFDLSQERVVVVGNGNVAMDVARILLTNPEELVKTDIADHALEELRKSKVREVVMLGRRSPAQASFTNPELKEFGELSGVDVVIDPADLVLDPQSETYLESDRTAKKNVETLRSFAGRAGRTQPRRIVFRFLVSPVEIGEDKGRVGKVKIEKNRLESQSDGTLRAKGTGQYETIEAGMVLRSVGYRGVALKGVPFDESTGTIPNVAGRVILSNSGETVTGEYVVGWAKRGPSGIIGTNKPDSAATVKAMVEDLPSLPGIKDGLREGLPVEELLRKRKIDCISFEAWNKINQAEVARGTEQGRPRVKFCRVGEMMEAASK